MMDNLGRWYPDFPGQQPYQDPAYMRAIAQQPQPMQGHQQPQPGQQMMTPPTIDAKIIQVDDLGAIDRFPMGAGTSQMFMTKDEKHIAIRSMYANGQHMDEIYDRRAPEPPAPTLNPQDYIRRDELPALLAEAMKGQKTPREATNKGEAA